jgi:hypothetical protein
VNEHLTEIKEYNPLRDENWITREHNLKFIKWFEEKVKSQTIENVNETVQWLSYGLGSTVHTYQGYDLNGYTWYTKK